MNEELKSWIADYDSGKIVDSVEMGGISDGYEMAIQDCAIDIMRTLSDKQPPEDRKEFASVVDLAANESANKLNDKHGFSGAQVGAAKNLSAVFWRQTPLKGISLMHDQDPERIIQIKKNSKGVPELASQKV